MGAQRRLAGGASEPPATPANRCRLCTSNDREALILSVAQDLWASVEPLDPDPLPWERADYWRPIYIGLATRAVESLEREHRH